jgi:release factor glutamine methyltransferase
VYRIHFLKRNLNLSFQYKNSRFDLPYVCVVMPTDARSLFNHLTSELSSQFGKEEASSITRFVIQEMLGISNADILSGKSIRIADENEERLKEVMARLQHNEPVQYVLGVAYFFGRRFHVDHSVLIPRPETEELVELIINYSKNIMHCAILDIGTGSGCISVTLAIELPSAKLFATDVSEKALEIAKRNAETLAAQVTFLKHDILHEKLTGTFDVVVSNPPYISWSEKKSIADNVVNFEPHLALFVNDDDPLIFYKEIARKSHDVLKEGGLLAVEINERFGAAVAQIFLLHGFCDVAVVKDISGKDRFVKALRN